MKKLALLLLLLPFILNAKDNKIYQPLKVMKADLHTHYYRAAILTQKKYVTPKYKDALKAYKVLQQVEKGKKKLPPKEIEKLKKILINFKLWDKLSKLYYKAHLTKLASYIGKAADPEDESVTTKLDSTSTEAAELNSKIALSLFRFFKENPELTKEKNFKVPMREIYHTHGSQDAPKESLNQSQRAQILELAKNS